VTISIVIPVHGHAAVTRQCLDRLLAGLAEDIEIVVVDDGSRDETASALASYGNRVKVVTHDRARGFATACNAGVRAAAGSRVVLLNNDTSGQQDWLAALIRYADDHERAAAVGARLLTQDQAIQHAGVVLCHDLLPRHVYRGFPHDHPAVTRSRQFQAVTAACMLLSRVAFEEVGGFDERFRNGYEDVDLCLRLREHGHEVHYCHESVSVHFESATRGDDAEAFAHNARAFLDRWGDRVVPDDLKTYVEDGLISIAYSDVYPLRLQLSPAVALVEESGGVETAFELLGLRSHQVFELLKENTLLRVRLGELTGPEAVHEVLRAEASDLEAFRFDRALRSPPGPAGTSTD
jgi:GT2 family glycosyltransferase